jgi:hypothetical protein
MKKYFFLCIVGSEAVIVTTYAQLR